MFLVSSCSCLCPIHWSHLLCAKWWCSWSSGDRRCSNHIWVIMNVIAYCVATYIIGLTIHIFFIFLSTDSAQNKMKKHNGYYILCNIKGVSAMFLTLHTNLYNSNDYKAKFNGITKFTICMLSLQNTIVCIGSEKTEYKNLEWLCKALQHIQS